MVQRLLVGWGKHSIMLDDSRALPPYEGHRGTLSTPYPPDKTSLFCSGLGHTLQSKKEERGPILLLKISSSSAEFLRNGTQFLRGILGPPAGVIFGKWGPVIGVKKWDPLRHLRLWLARLSYGRGMSGGYE